MKTLQMTAEGHPPLCMIFGDSGMGKTTDCGYSFPNALYIAAPGALTSIEATCGYKPAEIDAEDITDATAKIKKLLELGAEYDAVVVDDFSFLHQKELSKWEQKNSKNAFFKFNKTNDAVLAFRNAARYAGLAVIVNCWEKPPKTSGGVYRKGGPALSGQMGEALPSMFDIVLRSGYDPNRRPWTGVYHCSQDPSWVTKDRTNIAGQLKVSPMNLGEILRASGKYNISRLKGLEWQEEVVEQLTLQFLEGMKENPAHVYDLANEAYANLTHKISPPFSRWTVRDALDRTIIRRGLAESQASFC